MEVLNMKNSGTPHQFSLIICSELTTLISIFTFCSILKHAFQTSNSDAFQSLSEVAKMEFSNLNHLSLRTETGAASVQFTHVFKDTTFPSAKIKHFLMICRSSDKMPHASALCIKDQKKMPKGFKDATWTFSQWYWSGRKKCLPRHNTGDLKSVSDGRKRTIYRFKLQLCNLFASPVWDTWRLLGLTSLSMIFLLSLIFFLMPKSLC